MLFRFEQLVPLPREVVFRFHANPAQLALLLEHRRGFRLLGHEGHIRPGAMTRVVDPFGPLPVAMAFEHVLLDPPSVFEERMVHGPFERFVHRHEFHPEAGGTRLVDLLDIALPPWLGGETGMRLVAGPHIRRAFAHRHAELLRLARDGTVERLAAQTS
jgi:ligand-binding SRPBCC domain-containing protein